MNIINKIWDKHKVKKWQNSDPDIFFIDLHLIHEVTSPQAFSMLREKWLKVFDTSRTFATIDHSIPTDKNRENYSDENAKNQVETLKKNCKEYGITLFDDNSWNQWIVHVIWPELWLTSPWKTIVCWDSHTATHWAFWAIAFWIWTSQVWHVLATGCLLLNKPKTMKVEFVWIPSKYFYPKDAILKLIKEIWIQWWTWYAIEFCWEYIKNMSMEWRMTICNMAIECWAKYWLVAPDEITFAYLKWRKYAKEIPSYLKDKDISQNDSEYDKVLKIDIQDSLPFITRGTNPEQSVMIWENIPFPEDFEDKAKQTATKMALAYTKLNSWDAIVWTKIDYVFLWSCTNWRIEDFEVVANLLNWKKISNSVIAYLVPWSHWVKKACDDLWYTKIFKEAWIELREPWCSMCLAMNWDFVPEWKRCASTSNRNFVWRQWQGSYTHLMSPYMAWLCLLYWEIVSPEDI